MIPFVLIILYSILYLTSRDFIMAIMPDVTVIYCIFYIAIFENCLDSGLISMNTGYNMIFDCLSVPVLITKRDFQVLLPVRLSFGVNRRKDETCNSWGGPSGFQLSITRE